MRLKVFFRWAAGAGLLLSDPAAALELPKKRKRKHPPYLSQKEMAALLDSIPTQTRQSIRDRATLELLYSTGLRTAELCRLTLSDINFADGTVRVLLGKGGKDRIVPAGKLALSYVDRYLQQARGLWPGPLFAHLQTPKGISGRYLARIIRNAADAAGIRKRCTPRTFRHSFAIHLLERGAGIAHIGAMMGHADLSTTQIYTNIVKAELKRAHLAAHPAERSRCALMTPDPGPVALRDEKGRFSLRYK
jgi:integrase/recombinase XerD